MKNTEIKDLISGYYWARHNGFNSESLAQNTSWRPVEVIVYKDEDFIRGGKQSPGTRVYEFMWEGSLTPEYYDFGEKIDVPS